MLHTLKAKLFCTAGEFLRRELLEGRISVNESRKNLNELNDLLSSLQDEVPRYPSIESSVDIFAGMGGF